MHPDSKAAIRLATHFGLVCSALAGMATVSSAQQVKWVSNPTTGKTVGLTFGSATWDSSQAVAQYYGGNLATVRDQADRDWLVSNFASAWTTTTNTGPWVGYTDRVLEGTWRWISGATNTYAPWAPSQPDNAGGNEDWAHFNFSNSTWLFNDGPVSFATRALIEINQVRTPSWTWPTTINTASRPLYNVLADVNIDGRLDYVVGNRDSGSVRIYQNATPSASLNPVFNLVQEVINCGSVHTLLVADMDFDGDKDILGTDLSGNRVFLLSRDAQGFYGAPSTFLSVTSAYGITMADLDGNEQKDIVVTSIGADDRIRVFLRNAQGAYPATASQTLGPIVGDAHQASVGDVNADGFLDIVVGGGAGSSLHLGNANGVFTAGTSINTGLSINVALLDLDVDGDLDLVAPDHGADLLRVFRYGASGYQAAGTLPCGDGPRWVTAGDLNGDGLDDIAAAGEISDTVHVFLNSGLQQPPSTIPNYTLIVDHVLVGQDFPTSISIGDLNRDAKFDLLTTCHLSNTFSVHMNQSFFDCNLNSIADSLDISTGASTDCNTDRIPDECNLLYQVLTDCDFNGVADLCQIQSNPQLDCNGNLAFDGCDIAQGTSLDANFDGVPDECSQDCNGNGFWDTWEIASGLQPDCNLSGYPDSCDINGWPGTPPSSRDQNGDTIPDECQPLGTVRCPGDGTAAACPCGNTGGAGRGCRNTVANSLGGLLRCIGEASVSNDTVMLIGSGMSNTAVGLYIQGTTAAGTNGLGAVFGDGLRCASGVVVRLGIKTASGGTSEYPRTGDVPVSIKGLIPATGATRIYQLWYRDPGPFCTSSTFNLTNGVQVIWTP
jgi:hypothetical protein